METRSRTVAKAISWRIMAAIITSVIAWKLSGDGAFGVKMGLLDCAIKLVLYYVHERAWNRVSFGYRAPASIDAEPRATAAAK